MDLETTGLSLSVDRIVEIGLLKVHPDRKEEIFSNLVNPEIPIPEEVIAIHGITNEDVAGKQTFKEIAEEVERFISDCDIAGFNVKRFDLPFIRERAILNGIRD